MEVSPPPLRRRHLPSNPATNTNSAPPPPLLSVENPNLLRIFSWNVNGIEPFLQMSITTFFAPKPSQAAYSLRNFLRGHKWPHLLCLQEVKIAPGDEHAKRALERAANSTSGGGEDDDNDGPGYRAHYCLPQDKYNAKGFAGKIYGVATFIRSDFLLPSSTTTTSNSIVTRCVPWDLEGRVLITELSGAKLAVVNGYWVNGTDKAYRDPRTGAVVGTRHDRKREFHRLMLQECKGYEGRGWRVCLVGDMNVARGSLDGVPGVRVGAEHVRSRADFNAKFFDDDEKEEVEEGGLRGMDVFRRLWGERKQYTYYGRGVEWGSSCDRVDLVIVSRGVLDVEGLLVGTGILDTIEERGHSDHVPLWVSFDLGKLK